MQRRSLRPWIIGGIITIIVIAGLSVGITQIVKANDVAQAKASLQTTPVVGVTQITISNYAFSAPNVQVPVGTTITWTNQDSAVHTVTFDHGSDSGPIAQGGSYQKTFTQPGVFTYRCIYHEAMLGKITVTP